MANVLQAREPALYVASPHHSSRVPSLSYSFVTLSVLIILSFITLAVLITLSCPFITLSHYFVSLSYVT